MSAFSKRPHPTSTTLSCHELVHVWTPSCTNACAGIFRSCFLESLKIYSVLYLVGGILRKAGVKYFTDNYLQDVLRSSLFLGVNGGGLAANICLLRKLLGSFNFTTVVFLPGLISSVVAILIEKKGRRSTLALYMTNLAIETMYNMLKQRQLVKPIPNGEIILFCTATATMMYLYQEKGGLADGLLNSLIRFFLGSGDSRHQQDEQCTRIRSKQIRSNWLKATLKAFGTGYLIQLVSLLSGRLKYLTTKPGLFFRSFFNKDCVRCGLFLGSFVSIYKIAQWVLGLLRKKTDRLNDLIAGGMAGLSMIFYRSSTIALYLASKMFEVLYKQGTSAGILPSIPHAVILTYSFSTALLFHASVWEVQCVRPSYWRYLNVVTAKRFCELNRWKADELFGTDSAKLFPKDDLYCSLRRR
ncbi:transmembrane protein 135-like [Acropora muricata]|uniref:transmembrane protein 135-like n=1 Tax=Acropora muricata TaxID=159855 RepID=UPI0034E3CB8A